MSTLLSTDMNAKISEHCSAEMLVSGAVIITNHNKHTKNVSIVLAKDEVSKLRIALEAFERKQDELAKTTASKP